MEIECKFDNVKWNFKDPKTCKVTSCNITTRDAVIAVFKGVHKKSKSNIDVEALWFKNTTVNYIPRNLTTIFPNLTILVINNCGLKEISAADMVGLEQLKVFWALNNDFTTLPVDLFKNMPKLKEVCLNHNEIEKFDVKILEPIKDTIESFEILGNPGVDETFEKDVYTAEDFIKRLKTSASNQMNSKRLENLFTSAKYSDFTIKVQDNEYKVHKCILASLSSVFDKLFSDNPNLTSKTFVNIKNFSESSIEEFIRYFYSRADPSEENVKELLVLAVMFDVPDLKQQCEDVLTTTISAENAHDLYNLAVRHSLQDLKQKAFEAIKERHPDIGDYLFDEPKLVDQLIKAKDKHQAKKIKLDQKK